MRTVSTSLACLLFAAPGCTSFFGGPSTLTPGAIPSGTLALMGPPTSETEREGRLSAADKPLNPRAIKRAFWGGVLAASVGGALTLGFGAAGASASKRLAGDFDEGLTYSERDDGIARGEAYNALTITGATLTITGIALAAIAYAVDATRCGPLRQKREDCPPQ